MGRKKKLKKGVKKIKKNKKKLFLIKHQNQQILNQKIIKPMKLK